jgi:photosystem II stability/assembly factor-like uncharacterized protein
MKLSFQILLLLLFYSGYSFAQWYSIENGSAGDAYKVKFKDENTGWYLSDGTKIYKTTNGGIYWKCLDITNIDTLKNMYIMLNSGDTLWIPANAGRLLKSTNGGSNWTVINLNPGYKIIRFSFIRQNLIYAIYEYNSNAYLMKSTNTGLNWTTIYNFPNDYSQFFDFTNDSTGYLMLFNKIIKTTNYGYNWQVINIDSSILHQQLSYMKFVNNSLGFISNGINILYRTINGGVNWAELSINSIIRDIIFDDTLKGYMIGSHGPQQFYKTSNGGLNWDLTYIYSDINYRIFMDLEKKSNSIYIAAYSGGSILKSTNGGLNWIDFSPFFTETYFNTIAFANSQTGFIGASDRYLLKTTNSGLNWFLDNNIPINTQYSNSHIIKIQFINENTGWLLSDTGFYKTTNSGTNWIYFPTAMYQPDMFFYLNSLTGWVAKDTVININTHSAIYKTTNSGLNFTFKGLLNADWSSDIKFYDSLYGYISFLDFFTSDTNLYRTTDGGNSWQGIKFGQIMSIQIIDRKIALVAGDDIYKTTNGGDNWYKILDNNYGFHCIKFLNRNTGFACTNGKNLYYTTNGGENWSYSYIGNVVGLSDIYISSGGIAFMVGDYGKIYRTDNYGGIIGINNINTIIPDKYELLQNYPNPFNPTTIIRFKIKESKYVELKVFDILGKEVETLVSEKLQSGEYESVFNGSSLPSGIYFYKLSAGNYINTKKMVLVK